MILEDKIQMITDEVTPDHAVLQKNSRSLLEA